MNEIFDYTRRPILSIVEGLPAISQVQYDEWGNPTSIISTIPGMPGHTFQTFLAREVCGHAGCPPDAHQVVPFFTFSLN